MSYSLVLQSEAIYDIQEAFEWYERQRTGLGLEFIMEIEGAHEKICNHPQYYKAINERYRRLKVNRFPYLIVYEVEETTIIVNSVRHTRRKPKY
jgi:plasmid stabilization system protein ParE